jgi:hypothetical protein
MSNWNIWNSAHCKGRVRRSLGPPGQPAPPSRRRTRIGHRVVRHTALRQPLAPNPSQIVVLFDWMALADPGSLLSAAYAARLKTAPRPVPRWNLSFAEAVRPPDRWHQGLRPQFLGVIDEKEPGTNGQSSCPSDRQ